MRDGQRFCDSLLHFGKIRTHICNKKRLFQRILFSIILLLLLITFAETSIADVNSPQGALDIAGIVPGNYLFAEKRQDIIGTAEAAISSVKGIVGLMKQVNEVNAMLSPSEDTSRSSSKEALDLVLKVSAIIPDFPENEKNKTPLTPKPGTTKTEKAKTVIAPPINSVLDSKNLQWPTDGVIYSAFRATRGKKLHGAIDIVTKKGTPILAAADGVVSVVANGGKKYSGYGKIIIIDHGKGVHTVYAHCDTQIVKMGQKIKKGTFIGTVGRTGRASTDHVHFEVRIAGKKVDPLNYLPSRPGVVKTVNWHSKKKSSN
ncbi:MAG: M23 family metallopeptidase [Synergistaceae bacterium]|jgi:hypothetical protein|nr:M23 family metallopeptidase [Synergistaceae bacterium]